MICKCPHCGEEFEEEVFFNHYYSIDRKCKRCHNIFILTVNFVPEITTRIAKYMKCDICGKVKELESMTIDNQCNECIINECLKDYKAGDR